MTHKLSLRVARAGRRLLGGTVGIFAFGLILQPIFGWGQAMTVWNPWEYGQLTTTNTALGTANATLASELTSLQNLNTTLGGLPYGKMGTGSVLQEDDLIRQHTKMVAALQELQAQTAFALNSLTTLRNTGQILMQDPNGQTWSVPLQGWAFDSNNNVIGTGNGINPGSFMSPRFGRPIDELDLSGNLIYLTPQQTTQLVPRAVTATNNLGPAVVKSMVYGVGNPIGGAFPYLMPGNNAPTTATSNSLSSLISAVGLGSSAIPLANGASLSLLAGGGTCHLDAAYYFLKVKNPSPENAILFAYLVAKGFGNLGYDERLGLFHTQDLKPLESAADPATLDNLLTNGLTNFFNANAPNLPNPYANFAVKLGWSQISSILNNALQQLGSKFIALDKNVQAAELQPIIQRAENEPTMDEYLFPGQKNSAQNNYVAPQITVSSNSNDPNAADYQDAIDQQNQTIQANAAQSQSNINANPDGALIRMGPLPDTQKQWSNMRLAVKNRLSSIEVEKMLLYNQLQLNSQLASAVDQLVNQIDAIQVQTGARGANPGTTGPTLEQFINDAGAVFVMNDENASNGSSSSSSSGGSNSSGLGSLLGGLGSGSGSGAGSGSGTGSTASNTQLTGLLNQMPGISNFPGGAAGLLNTVNNIPGIQNVGGASTLLSMLGSNGGAGGTSGLLNQLNSLPGISSIPGGAQGLLNNLNNIPGMSSLGGLTGLSGALSNIPGLSSVLGGASGLMGVYTDKENQLGTTPLSASQMQSGLTASNTIPQLAQTEIQLHQFLFALQKDNREIIQRMQDLQQRIHDELMRLDDAYVSIDKETQAQMEHASSEMMSMEYASTQ